MLTRLSGPQYLIFTYIQEDEEVPKWEEKAVQEQICLLVRQLPCFSTPYWILLGRYVPKLLAEVHLARVQMPLSPIQSCDIY